MNLYNFITLQIKTMCDQPSKSHFTFQSWHIFWQKFISHHLPIYLLALKPYHASQQHLMPLQ